MANLTIKIQSLIDCGMADVAIYVNDNGAICNICIGDDCKLSISGKGKTTQQAIDNCDALLTKSNVIRLH